MVSEKQELRGGMLNILQGLPTSVPAELIVPVLAVGYAAAGLLLFANLYSRGFLRGNVLGIFAALIFLMTSATYFAHSFFSGNSTVETWVHFGVNFIAFASILVFVVLSFRSKFVMGGYKSLMIAHKQLQNTERWMKLMQEHMSDGLAVFSLEGGLLYVNPAALSILNLTEAAIGQKADIMVAGSTFNREEVEQFKDRVKGGETVSTRVVLKNVGSVDRAIEIRLSPVYGSFKNVIAVAATYRDITDIYSLERAKEEFIQIASHELRTPLTAVRGFLSLLQMNRYGKLTASQKSLIDKASLAGGRLSKLVDNLLMVARIEENRIILNLEMVDIHELIESAASELMGEADRCSVTLRVLWPKTALPEIITDRDKLFHVIINLLANAIKYTPENGHVFVEPKVKGDMLEISISDTGVGIERRDLERLFHKFERIKNSRSVRVGGSGLGLVIVKSFTEALGGKVTVSSKVGHGSTFTVTLPIQNDSYV